MDSSDWSNGIRYHAFDTRSDTCSLVTSRFGLELPSIPLPTMSRYSGAALVLLALAVAAPRTNADWSTCSGPTCPQDNCDGSYTVRNASVQKQRTHLPKPPLRLPSQNTNDPRASRAGSAPRAAPGPRSRTNVKHRASGAFQPYCAAVKSVALAAPKDPAHSWADSTVVASWHCLGLNDQSPYRAAYWRSGGGGEGVASCGACASPAGGFDAVGRVPSLNPSAWKVVKLLFF